MPTTKRRSACRRYGFFRLGEREEAFDTELSHQLVALCSDWLVDELSSVFDHLGDHIERQGFRGRKSATLDANDREGPGR